MEWMTTLATRAELTDTLHGLSREGWAIRFVFSEEVRRQGGVGKIGLYLDYRIIACRATSDTPRPV